MVSNNNIDQTKKISRLHEKHESNINIHYLTKQEFTYFHPLFILMIHQQNVIKLLSIYTNKKFSSSIFSIEISTRKLNYFPILLTITDELCGLLVSLNFEEIVYFTSEMNITKNTTKETEKMNEPKHFLIETSISEALMANKKLKLNFKIIDDSLESIFEGYAYFIRPKVQTPHSKF